MAQVAKCPHCEHDLLVPDEATASGLAKCPACKSFFELGHAEVRELLPVVLVDSEIQAAEANKTPTIADAPPVAAESNELPQELELQQPEQLDKLPLELEISSGESPDAAAQRIDQWFRSAKTLSDMPNNLPPPAAEGVEAAESSPGSHTIDISDMHATGGFDSDFELEQPPEALHGRAPWDDSQDMERLLAEVENEPAHPFAAASGQDASNSNEQHVESAENWSPDASMSMTRESGEPRRKRSIVRTLVGTVVGGVVGLALAYYALLWLRGPAVDVLDLAKYLPQAALPASFHPEVKKSAVGPPPSLISDLAAADKGNQPAPKATEPPAEKQVAYTAPAAPPKSTPPADDRYPAPAAKTEAPAHEPDLLDAPPATVLRGNAVSEPIHIANAPSFTAKDLVTALEAAKDARPGLVLGSLSDGKEVQHAKGASYAVMADLAQKATFAAASASPSDRDKTNEQIEKLFRETLLDAHTRGEIGQIVPKWIASPNRKHGGVFFAGSVTHHEMKGVVLECSFEVGGDQVLVLLAPSAAMKHPLDASSQPVGVIGWIVDKPAEQIKGYTGSAPQAVFANQLIQLQ